MLSTTLPTPTGRTSARSISCVPCGRTRSGSGVSGGKRPRWHARTVSGRGSGGRSTGRPGCPAPEAARRRRGPARPGVQAVDGPAPEDRAVRLAGGDRHGRGGPGPAAPAMALLPGVHGRVPGVRRLAAHLAAGVAVDRGRGGVRRRGGGAAAGGRLRPVSGPPSFPRQHARTRGFTLGEPRGFSVAAGGGRVAFLRSLAGDDPVNRLWVLDLERRAERLVADPVALVGAGEELPAAERARRERARERAGGIVAYGADRDLTVAAFALSGRLFVAALA